MLLWIWFCCAMFVLSVTGFCEGFDVSLSFLVYCWDLLWWFGCGWFACNWEYCIFLLVVWVSAFGFVLGLLSVWRCGCCGWLYVILLLCLVGYGALTLLGLGVCCLLAFGVLVDLLFVGRCMSFCFVGVHCLLSLFFVGFVWVVCVCWEWLAGDSIFCLYVHDGGRFCNCSVIMGIERFWVGLLRLIRRVGVVLSCVVLVGVLR